MLGTKTVMTVKGVVMLIKMIKRAKEGKRCGEMRKMKTIVVVKRRRRRMMMIMMMGRRRKSKE